MLAFVALTPGAAAQAQVPAPADGDYGGGALAIAPDLALGTDGTRVGVGNMLVSLRTTGAGALVVDAIVGAACEGTPVSAKATLKPDGTFAALGKKSTLLPDGRRVRSVLEISGTVSGATASGVATARNRITRRGERAQTCASPTVEWNARRPTSETGAAGAVPGALLFGTTSQRLGGVRRAVVVRVSADRKELDALYGSARRCGSRIESSHVDATDGPVEIKAGGVVHDIDVLLGHRDRTKERKVTHFTAALGALGGKGAFTIVERVLSVRTGRRIASCGGSLTWRAAP